MPKRLNEELSSNIAIKVGGGEFSQRGLQTSSSRMVETEVQFDKPEPDTFMTQKRHPVHHFINFDSANFCIGKSMRDVKSVVEWVRSWKTATVSKYSFSKQKVTSL